MKKLSPVDTNLLTIVSSCIKSNNLVCASALIVQQCLILILSFESWTAFPITSLSLIPRRVPVKKMKD